MAVKKGEYNLDERCKEKYSDINNKNNACDEVNSKESDNENVDINDKDECGINTGWADSVTKILNSSKPRKKRTLVLSKAKKISDVKQEKATNIGFEIEGKIKDEKPDLGASHEIETAVLLKKQKKEKCSIRVKPSILERDRERTLAKIATRGVVQLFNSVRMQQKDITNKLNEAGALTHKREKILKNIDKRTFLDVLMGAKSERVDRSVKKETKRENKEEQQIKCTWNVLRDDFMMGAKFQDWDKKTDDKDEESTEFSESQ